MAEDPINSNFYWNKKLEQIIARWFPNAAISLREMHLIDKDMPMIINEALVQKQCTEIDLSCNRFTSEGMKILANAFNQNLIRLEVINLNSNAIGNEGVRYIASALRTYHLLTRLFLGRTGINDDVVPYIVELLADNRRIFLLELEYNDLTSAGVIGLSQAVSESMLNYFYIGNNRNVDDECVDSLCQMIRKSNHLVAISLNDIDFSHLMAYCRDRKICLFL